VGDGTSRRVAGEATVLPPPGRRWRRVRGRRASLRGAVRSMEMRRRRGARHGDHNHRRGVQAPAMATRQDASRASIRNGRRRVARGITRRPLQCAEAVRRNGHEMVPGEHQDQQRGLRGSVLLRADQEGSAEGRRRRRETVQRGGQQTDKRDSPAEGKDDTVGEKRLGETTPTTVQPGGVKRAKPSPGTGGAQRSLHSFFKKS
jgi:hypothetical protein